MDSKLTVEGHSHLATGINAAVLMVSLCAGKTPQQVAAEIASRVIHKLCAQLPTEAAQRETAP